jgi:hypothetical protein
MNLRHAAALALVGWYLMAPPLIKGAHNTYTVYRSAPCFSGSMWNPSIPPRNANKDFSTT